MNGGFSSIIQNEASSRMLIDNIVVHALNISNEEHERACLSLETQLSAELKKSTGSLYGASGFADYSLFFPKCT